MNQKQPKISIVVPVYNVEKYLDKCVNSLTYQTLRDIEIILVDDGSPDKCPKMCDEYAKKDNRIQVIHKPNGGLSSARNAGLEFISGEYYMFVDSDDWLDEKACEDAYNEITKQFADCLMFSYTKEFGNHSIINHVFEKEHFVWNKEDVMNKFHRRLFGLIGEELACPQDGDLIVSACMQLFRTDKFKDIRFVDTKIIGTEDCWYQILLYQHCDKFVYIDKPYYHYLRINDSSLTTKYNPHLYSRWQKLYDYMGEYIEKWNLGELYVQALQNRISLSVLGAGLNLTHSHLNIWKGGKEMKTMLETPRYKEALSSLDVSIMPIHWKIFFGLAKHGHTTLLFMMLKILEYIRTHRN